MSNNGAGLNLAASLDRLGTESAFEVLERARQLAVIGKDIINLGIGQPDFKTPDHITEAAVKALRDGHHGYTPANGIPQLREAVAEDLHRRHGVDVNPDHVVIVPGGKPTMFFAMLMFGEPGAEIMYPNPGFPIYESMIRFSGARAVPFALEETNGFAFSAEAVLSQINELTRLIIVNSPANPTGGITPKEEIDKFCEGLEGFPHVAVLSDEIYSNMLYGGRQHTSFLQYPALRDRLIMLDGWSKSYAMTGWRIGYAVWPESCVEYVTRLCINDHSCVNAAVQQAAIAALKGPQDAVHKMVSEFDGRRRIIVDGLNKIPGVRCVDAAGAFYAFPNIEETGLTSRDFQNHMLEKAGVATVSGTSFGSWGEGYVRFSYANSTENINRALERVAAAL
ncbi:MAG: pyridoxal phosphate-dependent aminotransferase [Rhodobacteraceae bacterium]|nr:pyridoxal phosphate-dependent aminotransferase [Paracoccaceae bacterium]